MVSDRHDLASNVIANGEGGGCADLHGQGGGGGEGVGKECMGKGGRSAWGRGEGVHGEGGKECMGKGGRSAWGRGEGVHGEGGKECMGKGGRGGEGVHGEGGKRWGRSAWGGREEVGEGMGWGHLPSMCKRRNIKPALFWHIIYPHAIILYNYAYNLKNNFHPPCTMRMKGHIPLPHPPPCCGLQSHAGGSSALICSRQKAPL